MPSFFSPNGNFEVWAEKPEGYFTPEEWNTAHPPVAPDVPPRTPQQLFMDLRFARDRKLAATDYALMPDYPATSEQKEAVAAYRQALRDLPQQEGAPWDGGGKETPWPAKPELEATTN